MSNGSYYKFKLWGLLVSKNIYNGKGKLKWCVREDSTRDVDNGWRFLSDIDSEEFLANSNNWCILAYESVIKIEPAVLAIYDMPVGTELTLMQEGKRNFSLIQIQGKKSRCINSITKIGVDVLPMKTLIHGVFFKIKH